jgi:hypothetical protein
MSDNYVGLVFFVLLVGWSSFCYHFMCVLNQRVRPNLIAQEIDTEIKIEFELLEPLVFFSRKSGAIDLHISYY